MALKKKIGLGKSKEKTNEKFTLGQFAWNGFNLTVAVAFIGSMTALAQGTKGGTGQQLGLWIFFVFALIGLVAGATAFAFSKLSRYHIADANGGAYIFARASFGRFIGFLTVFLNYIIMPLVLSNQILMFIKANFNPAMATASTGTEWWNGWTTHLGGWGNLTYDLIGIVLSVAFILVAFFGTKLYKRVAKYSLIVKWVTGGFFLVCGLAIAFMPAVGHSGTNVAVNMSYWGEHSNFSVGKILAAFCTCFYYFTGFESFATSSATVKNPEKNISKGIMIVIFAATAFYLGEILIFMMAMSPDTNAFSQNMSTGFWVAFSEQAKWMMYLGPIVMIVSTIALRGNTISQITLYGGTTLQPMSQEGYVSDHFSKQNEVGFPIGAMKLNLIISAITIGMWAILPDIIVGALNTHATEQQIIDGDLRGDFINVNSIINPASVFYIGIYVIVLLTVLKHGFKGVIKLTVLEWALYSLSLVFLGVVFVYHFYDLFNNAFNANAYMNSDGTSDQTNNIVAMAVELAFLALCILFIVLVYFCYYKKKYSQRLKKTPKVQKTLNYQFRLFDGWDYIKGTYNTRVEHLNKQRTRLIKQYKGDTTNFELLDEYQLLTDEFIAHNELTLIRYLKYSSRVLRYNIKHGNNNTQEIKANNVDARRHLDAMHKAVGAKLATVRL